MARIRDDYEASFFARFMKWIREGDVSLDESMIKELDETADKGTVNDEADRPETFLTEKWMRGNKRDDAGKAGSGKLVRRVYIALSIAVCLGIICVLLAGAAKLPSFGDASNPVNNEVTERYIEKGMEETGAVNVVAGMILDYRAFDTLGESNVLFVAACAVIILMRISGEKTGRAAHELEIEADDRMYEPKHDIILQFVTKITVPLVLLFGMYVILNGHISPGGGFSGGALMGAGLILYLIAFGFKKAERFFTFRTFRTVSVISLSFYAVSKAYSFFTGANDLTSIITPGVPGRIFSAGLIPYLNLTVGLVVCCTMYAFYTLFRKGDV